MRLFIEKHNAALRDAYRSLPRLLIEHYGIEQTVLAGGYGYRQVMELVQNGADAILEAHEHGLPPAADNRIHVLLRESRLYVANSGASLSEDGIDALLSSHSSPKRGNQIGRFGLGFKSLLRLGGTIDIFTRTSGAFRFDPALRQGALKREFNVSVAPALRLAWPLAKNEQSVDGVLDELAWAETIVRAEVQTPGILEHLQEEIRTFPAEFLLFFPVTTILLLDDGQKPSREVRVEPDNNRCLLHDGSGTSSWHIAKRDLTIADARALDDATHIHARDSVPLAWAIPLEGKREEAGRFWAFFPTHTPTYLPGILNAPWKLNSDRNAIIGGEWNTTMMHEAARLIVDTLPKLQTDIDPGRILEAFPRQLERKDEDAAPLVEALWIAIENAALIPDATSTLRPAYELWRHPRENPHLARQWQLLADDNKRMEMVHPSCLERQRGSRLNALAERLCKQGTKKRNLRKSETVTWFSAIATGEWPQSVQVLKLAEAYAEDCRPEEWSSVRPLIAIVPTDDGQLVIADQAVFAPEGIRVPNGRHPVARSLCEDAEAKRILAEVMKIKQLDERVWLEVLGEALPIHHSWESPSDKSWCSFWECLRSAPETIRRQFVQNKASRIRVRRRDREWVLRDEVLLPGALVEPNDASANQDVLIDFAVHDEDRALLVLLGVCDFPEGAVEVNNSTEIGEWLGYWRKHYRSKVNGSASSDYLKPRDLKLPKGFTFLPKLCGRPNAKLTERFLARYVRKEFAEKIQFGHCTVKSYRRIDVPHPLAWLLLKHGTVQVGDEMVRLVAVVARRRESALSMMPNWKHLEPLLQELENVIPPVLATQAEIRDLWLALSRAVAISPASADDFLRGLWAGMAKDNVAPQSLRTEEGAIPLPRVFVTSSSYLAKCTRASGRIIVALDEYTLRLWLESGARNLTELFSPVWTEKTGPDGFLVAAIPEIAEVLRDEAKGEARCQPVAGLKLVIEGDGNSIPCLMWRNTLHLDLEQLSRLSRADRFKHLLDEAAAAGWLKHQPGEALRILGGAQVDSRRAKIAQAPTLAERLLLSVGDREEPLRQVLGCLATMDFTQECSPLQLAELTLAQLGPVTLSALKDTLSAEGLNPPSRWNTAEARNFVAAIGFPELFAVSPEARREPEELVSGPIELPALHDFQEEVLEGIRVLLASGTLRRRAVVSLPTGGGKTRVTVEGAVRLVLRPEGNRRSVLWVAQTDELCEQAVQAFRQVWINLGTRNTYLRIVRLWGGNPNPAIKESDRPAVVVASIQTLNSRMGTDGLAWFRKPGLVVVDECHHAITPSYTNLLRWLDAEATRSGTPEKEEPAILGLSATPFRTDDEESRRLAKRFDNCWFPSDQEKLHGRLCSQGVLARAISERLESGTSLLEEEIKRLSKLPEPWEGLDFENILEAINQRLAGNLQRNQLLVERIKKGEERTILFFANSVQHAQEISARLNIAGIPSAAVSGSTPSAVRRYFLERFQRGDIRVLCNHSVLSTGFDAPKTDMVLIARQVFSPVRYMQMVGRGLRGEKNGGKAYCRVVTVVDNFGRFKDKHPYHYCQQYFTSWSGGHLSGK